MDLATYKQRRLEALAQEPKFRQLCWTCLQPDFSCFCNWLKPFDPGMNFIILIHPIEVHRRIATGRMSHLSLKNSKLIMGHVFARNAQVQEILENRSLHCVMLYPGRASQNLTGMTATERIDFVPAGKRLTVIVIDGTWGTARTMVNQSENLKALPRICFTPTTPSNFRVRKQPRPDCYSTIEAIHHTIDLMGAACGFETSTREHDGLLSVFDRMVNRQLELAHSASPGPCL